jgi:hypothetical protein
MDSIEIPRFAWTTQKLIDELFLHLMRYQEIVTNEEGDQIRVRKYLRLAAELGRRIPVARPPPEYVIDRSDLDERLRQELDEIKSNDARHDVLKQAVGRIFENLNFERYHLSIARNLKVRLA